LVLGGSYSIARKHAFRAQDTQNTCGSTNIGTV